MAGDYHVAYSDGRIGRIHADTREIWRNMDLWKLVSMLEHRAPYFPVVALLGDPLEAAPPRVPNGSSSDEEWKHW